MRARHLAAIAAAVILAATWDASSGALGLVRLLLVLYLGYVLALALQSPPLTQDEAEVPALDSDVVFLDEDTTD